MRDVRCPDCNALFYKTLNKIIEIKCRRCKVVTRIEVIDQGVSTADVKKGESDGEW
jgi:phage FluMu protein Com